MQDNYEKYRNRKYVMEKRYSIYNTNQMFSLNQEIMELTKKSARLSVVVGSSFIIVNVYCKKNTSKVYCLCEDFGFERI